jgi:hypothetical protein
MTTSIPSMSTVLMRGIIISSSPYRKSAAAEAASKLRRPPRRGFWAQGTTPSILGVLHAVFYPTWRMFSAQIYTTTELCFRTHIYFPTLLPIVLPLAPHSRNMPAAATTTTQRIPRHDEYYIHGGDVVFCVRMSIIGRHVLTQSRESTGG